MRLSKVPTKKVKEPSKGNKALEHTGRKRTEGVLKKPEQLFARVFYANPIAICIMRLSDRRFLDVNDKLLQEMGHRWDEIVGHTTNDWDIWVDPEERSRFVQDRKAKQGS